MRVASPQAAKPPPPQAADTPPSCPTCLPAPAVVHVIDNVLLPLDLGLAGAPVVQDTKSAASSSAPASLAALAAGLLAAAMLV